MPLGIWKPRQSINRWNREFSPVPPADWNRNCFVSALRRSFGLISMSLIHRYKSIEGPIWFPAKDNFLAGVFSAAGVISLSRASMGLTIAREQFASPLLLFDMRVV